MQRTLTVLICGFLMLAVPATGQTAAGESHSQGPAASRLKELIHVVESGSPAKICTFIREAYAPEALRRNNEDRVVQWYRVMYDRSLSFEIDSLHATPTEAAALLRSELTGLWEQLSVRVEPEPPHRDSSGSL